MVKPHPTNSATFTYPPSRLLPLNCTGSVQEVRDPTTLAENGEPCMMVLRRGNTTGLTIGHANTIASFVRHYFNDKEPETSME